MLGILHLSKRLKLLFCFLLRIISIPSRFIAFFALIVLGSTETRRLEPCEGVVQVLTLPAESRAAFLFLLLPSSLSHHFPLLPPGSTSPHRHPLQSPPQVTLLAILKEISTLNAGRG